MDKERISLLVDDLKLVGEIYIPSHLKKEHYPGLCLCHGIPAQVQPSADRGYPFLAERFCSEGFMVLIFNFRGSGESQGNLDLRGWIRDLSAAIDYLVQRKEVDQKRISLMGFSAGAAVSVYVAAGDHRISYVVTCACPTEFSRIIAPNRIGDFLEQARQIGIIKDPDFPPSLEEWRKGFEEVSPIEYIDRISGRPIFIIHGDSDETVPVSHAWRLYEKAGNPKEILIAEGAVHRIRTDERAMNAALEWLKKMNGLRG